MRRMIAGLLLVGVGLLLATDGVAATTRSARPKQGRAAPAARRLEPRLEPRALEILHAMSWRLANARTLAFTAVATYESPSLLGPALAYTTTSQVFVQRPDRLAVITTGDGPASEFYYDGKTMMAYGPAENLVAIADAPPTIDAALKAAYDGAAIYFPFTDVVVTDPYADITQGLTHAFVVGQSKVVGGTTTDVVAIANDETFAQLWIGADDKLPRRIRAVYLRDPARLWHQVDLDDWKLGGSIPAKHFRSDRAASAGRIPFARPDVQTPPGVKR